MGYEEEQAMNAKKLLDQMEDIERRWLSDPVFGLGSSYLDSPYNKEEKQAWRDYRTRAKKLVEKYDITDGNFSPEKIKAELERLKMTSNE